MSFSIEQSSTRNRLLALLPPDDFGLLQPHLELLNLPVGTVLVDPNEACGYVYFLESGLASQIASVDGHRKLEVGIYGREGVGPTAGILGVDRSPHLHFMQLAGKGSRLPIAHLEAAMTVSPSLRGLLSRYTQVFMVQMGHTALSNGSAVIGERLARWLLMCHDRVDGDEIVLTHEFLGIMLGVRRAGVTTALHVLEGARLIRARRGHINIVDRAGLEATAGKSYGVPEAEYRRLLGALNEPERRAPALTRH